MYVCICHAVTDAEVLDAIDDGARDVSAVGRRTRAGTSCATCHDHLDEIIDARCEPCPLAAMRVA